MIPVASGIHDGAAPAYREIPPPPHLAPFVECFWTIRSGRPLPEPRFDRILPDGCSDFIFDLGDPPAGKGPRRGPRSYVVGTMRTALVVGSAGRVDLVGVRFRPGGASPVTGIPADELTGRVVALDDVVPAAGELESRLGEAPPAGRAGLLIAAIEERLRREGRGPDPRVHRAARLLEREDGRVSMAALAADVDLGRRQLERLFAREVGVPPKEAAGVARFRGAVRRLKRPPVPSLARVAYASGYHDQSHLTREFRRFAGITPGAYLREQAAGRAHVPARRVASVQDGPTRTR